jgi:hypothetical protein
MPWETVQTNRRRLDLLAETLLGDILRGMGGFSFENSFQPSAVSQGRCPGEGDRFHPLGCSSEART